ncbi:MAG TPA: hypothetical protein VGH20_14265 [Myxococcales bacterium]|jgi:hypothetical protein
MLLAVGFACGKGQSSGTASGGPPPAAQMFTLTVTVNGSGTVTSSPAGINCGSVCAMSFAAGTTVTLTAAATGQAAMPEWTGACNGPGSCSVTMNADAAVTVGFADTEPVQVPPTRRHTLAVSVTGSGTVTSAPAGINCGTTCSATFDEGTQVTLTAQPTSGANFSGFSGACSGTSCTVTLAADQTVTATFAAAPSADECAGLLPSALPAAIKATLPQNECLDATSDDGDGTFALGYTAGGGPTFPDYQFFSIQNGQAVRIGREIPGGDETATYVYSQPSGFTAFAVFGIDESSSITSYDHGGNQLSGVALARGDPNRPPSTEAGVDPSGGTATAKHVFDTASGTSTTTYKRFDKTGVAETGDVVIDTEDRDVRGVGVALSGHALVMVLQPPSQWMGRWIARDGTALTAWFALTGPVHNFTKPVIRFLMDGSVAVGFHEGSQGVKYSDVNYQYVVPDGQATSRPLPAWLQARADEVFYVARGGRAYAAWAGEGPCPAGNIEVLAATTGKSCGCLAVPSLGGNSSIGRDGSLMVSEPPVNFGTCIWDLYQHLLQ